MVWCDTVNEKKKGFFDWARAKCNLPRVLRGVVRRIASVNPDIFIFCTQNESQKSKLEDALRHALQNDSSVANYTLLLNYKHGSFFQSTWSIHTLVYVRSELRQQYLTVDDIPGAIEHRSRVYEDDAFGRLCVVHVFNLYRREHDDWIQIHNIHLPPTTQKMCIEDTLPEIQRDVLTAINGSFLRSYWNSLILEANQATHHVICGDFNALTLKGSIYDKADDELHRILDRYKWGSGLLREEPIHFSATYGRTATTACTSTAQVDESCYQDQRGWTDRILFGGMRCSEYQVVTLDVDESDQESYHHLPVYAILN